MAKENTPTPDQGGTLSFDVQETVSADFLGVLDVQLQDRLRYLPGRRSVWKARCLGRDVLLKLYDAHPKQERDVRFEWGNSIALQEAGLEIPNPLFLGRGEEGLLVVGFEFVAEGSALDSLLDEENSECCYKVLTQLVDLHRRQHAAGCFQRDNHLGNYLWSQGKLWMLDAGSCEFSKAPLGELVRTQNMALLAANIPLSLMSVFEQVMVDVYDHDLVDFESAVKSAIQTRARSYYKKTRRSCSEFEHIKTASKNILLCRDFDEELKNKFLSDPDQFFGEGEDMVKNGRTCSVVDIYMNGKGYILKRYNQKPLVYRLTHLLMTPRALLSWSNGHVLRLFGVASPRPVACFLLKTGMLVRKGYLLMEKVKGEGLDKIDRELMVDSTQDIPQQFGRIWQQLDLLDASHGDMKFTNFMVDEQGKLILIDLDSLKFHRNLSDKERGQIKDMKRFLRNWEGDVRVSAAFQEALVDR